MKVTDFFVIIFVITCLSCKQADNTEVQLAYQQTIDSIASKTIDSAYVAINRKCDSMETHSVPILVDSLVKLDSVMHLNDTLFHEN
jgi:hypothetical protein